METLYVTHAQQLRIKQIVAESEALPALQFAYFIGKVNTEIGPNAAVQILDAVKRGEKINVVIDTRN